MSDLSNNFNLNHPAQSDKFHQLYRFRKYRFISTMEILTNQTIDNHCMLELVFETKAEHTFAYHKRKSHEKIRVFKREHEKISLTSRVNFHNSTKKLQSYKTTK